MWDPEGWDNGNENGNKGLGILLQENQMEEKLENQMEAGFVGLMYADM